MSHRTGRISTAVKKMSRRIYQAVPRFIPDGCPVKPLARIPLGLSILLFVLLALSNGGCTSEDKAPKDKVSARCLECHTIELDSNHDFACIDCHGIKTDPLSSPFDHQEIVLRPGHPENAARYCGKCHDAEIKMVENSSHYTLESHLSLIRSAFGASSPQPEVLDLQSSVSPNSQIELVDDLLRRRCLRCHVYYEGDDFSGVKRGTGCSACHIAFEDGKPLSHRFERAPGDLRCLSCHYGNHVGFDYYGRFEHDYNQEYRTPYTADGESPKPYGVEYHQLEVDLHQKAGMICIDCHSKLQIMGGEREARPSCRNCHDAKRLVASLPAGVSRQDERYIFTSPATARILDIPLLQNPAHERYGKIVSCQACHARWIVTDKQTNLLRIDHDDFYEFARLTLDGSSEVKTIIGSYFDEEGEILEPVMTDKFNGESFPGIWFKGFGERRWEDFTLVKSEEGLLEPARQSLNLRLSWIDESETVRYDNIRPVENVQLHVPYVPHTTGPAGLFYEERLRPFLLQEKEGSSPTNE